MNQALHIFRKDSRRLWPEILLSLALFAAYAFLAPSAWMPTNDYSQRGRAQLVHILVVVSWWLLIGRLVHTESLVGENQQWLTRPYEWPKLLAAKWLFLLTWLVVPYLAMQAAVLREAGFHPGAHVGDMLYALLPDLIALLLPVFALAAVTATFLRMMLASLGIFLAYVALQYFAPTTTVRFNPYVPSPNQLGILIPIAVVAGIVVLQYCTRRVWLCRFLLLGTAAAFGAASLVPTSDAAVDKAYARGNIAGLRLTGRTDSVGVRTGSGYRGAMVIALGFKVAGLASGRGLQVEDVKFTFESPSEGRWSSGWQGQLQDQNAHYEAGAPDPQVRLGISRAVYDRFKDTPVHVHATVAVSEVKGETTSMALPIGDLAIPELGICQLRVGPPAAYSPLLNCRSGTRQLRLTRATILLTDWSDGPCSNTYANPGVVGEGWIGSMTPVRVDGLNPVASMDIGFSNSVDNDSHGRIVCPGSPTTFTTYRSTGRYTYEVDFDDVHLPPSVQNVQ